MPCIDKPDTACPFSHSEAAIQAENWGCLPSPWEVIQMRVRHGKTWACHSEPTKPCLGAIRALKEARLPHKVIDPVLATEKTGWPA